MNADATLTTNEPRSTLSTPRAGYDRIVLRGARMNDAAAARIRSNSFLAKLPSGYGRAGDVRLKKGVYQRRTDFQNKTNPSAPLVALHYRPRRFHAPAYQLHFRAASIGQLLDLDEVGAIHSALGTLAPIALSEVELTVDLPGGAKEAIELHAEFHPVKARHAGGHTTSKTYWFFGKGSSAQRMRLYHKSEDGMEAVRIELVLRRTALRRLRLDTLADLRMAPWREIAHNAFRLVRFHPGRNRKDGTLVATIAHTIQSKGIRATLSDFPLSRIWILRHLTPCANQRLIDDALLELEGKLQEPATLDGPSAKAVA